MDFTEARDSEWRGNSWAICKSAPRCRQTTTPAPHHSFYRPDALPAAQPTASKHTHPFNGPMSWTTQVSRYQKGKTNPDFTGARDSEWQWHQLGHMQVFTSLQTDNHASTSLLSFFTGQMPFLPPNQQCQSTEGKYQQHQSTEGKMLVHFMKTTYW